MLKQKFALNFGSKIIFQFIQLAATIIVARIAGPSVLGTVAFGIAFVTMFQFIGNLGLGSAHAKIVNEGYDINKCNHTFSFLYLLSKFTMIIIVIIYYLLQKFVFNYKFESSTHETVIFLSIITIFIQTFSEIPRATFMAKIEQAKQDIPELLRHIIYQPARIITVLSGGRSIPLTLVHLFSWIAILPVYIFLSKEKLFGKPDRVLMKKYLTYGLPLMAVAMAGSIAQSIDKVLLQYYSNSIEVGIYTSGARMGRYFQIIGATAGVIFFPLFASYIHNKDYDKVKQIIIKYEIFLWAFISPIIIVICNYSYYIVRLLFGNSYIHASGVLILLTLASFVRIVNIPFGNVIAGTGQFRLISMLNGIYILLMIMSMVILLNINPTGLLPEAVGLGILIANIFLLITYCYFAKKIINEINFFVYLPFIVISSMHLFIVQLIISNTSSQLTRLLAPIIAVILTYALYYFSGLVKKDDWKELLNLVNIKRTKNYIVKELNEKK